MINMKKTELLVSKPFKIKNILIKNRICFPAIICKRYENDIKVIVNELNILHYSNIAQGGCGLVIQEATAISKEGKIWPFQLGIYDIDHIDGLRKIVSKVHESGTKIFIQVNHGGIKSVRHVENNKLVKFKSVNELNFEDLYIIQNDYLNAIKMAKQIGYDGVEIHCCHGYLISQLLNTKINKRHDLYGSDTRKFIVDLIKKAALYKSNDFLVGVRLGAFEPDLESSIATALKLEKNNVDFIDVSYGATDEIYEDIEDNFKFSNAIYGAIKIKEKVKKTPIFAVDGIKSIYHAEELIRRYNIDIVDVGRAQLIDNNWYKKSLDGSKIDNCFGCKKCNWSRYPDLCPGILQKCK